MKKRVLEYSMVMVLFLAVSLFFFRGIITAPGAITGADWGLPITEVQIDQNFKGAFYSWGGQGAIFGARQTIFTPMIFTTLIKSLSAIGLTAIYTKLLLISLFTFAGITMYALARFFGLHRISSLLAGVLYITSPIFFNYSIMGWIFVLFVMGLLPLATIFFIRSVRQRRPVYAIVTGILYALSMIQSQSVIWFMMLFAALSLYLIRDKKSLYSYVKTLAIVVFLFFALNAYWILGLLIVPDVGISGSDIVKSTVSLGNLGHFKLVNMIRLFGSLFNFQYETALNNSDFPFLSFVVSFLAVSSLLVRAHKRVIISFWIMGLVPVFMYILNFNRDILLSIPFSNVIRDFLRFTVVSTFAYSFLAAVTVNQLLLKARQRYRSTSFALLILVITLLIVSIFPWWTGDIANWHPGRGCDQRFKAKVTPPEYIRLEHYLAKKRLDQKALFLPMGGTLDFKDDIKFHSMCNEMWDIYAGYSPIPAALTVSDRSQGHLTDYNKIIFNNLDENFVQIFAPTSIRYFVVRKNVLREPYEQIAEYLEMMAQEFKLSKISENKRVVIYASPNFLPHFYVPTSIELTNNPVESFPKIVSRSDYNLRSALFFEEHNLGEKAELFDTLYYSNLKQTPIIEFKKINPTKYRVVAHNVRESFPLVFSELFHDGWKAYVAGKSKVYKDESSKVEMEEIENYSVIEGNEADQASRGELVKFIQNGWISALGMNREVDFVSKNFQDTIQNDNLPNGRFYETWFPKVENGDVFQIPYDSHLMVNGYANSWIIDTEKICTSGIFCQLNPDGSYDMELVVEFWPQRIFYLGLSISGITLLLSLGYLARNRLQRKN